MEYAWLKLILIGWEFRELKNNEFNLLNCRIYFWKGYRVPVFKIFIELIILIKLMYYCSSSTEYANLDEIVFSLKYCMSLNVIKVYEISHPSNK